MTYKTHSSRATLTTVERLALSAYEKEDGEPVRNIAAFRQILRCTAYHEAGHAVATHFTGLEASHTVCVSIIPKGASDGYVTHQRNIAELAFAAYPPPLRRITGRMLLIQFLAGRVAAANVTASEDREEVLDVDSEEWDTEGSDLFRASTIANVMARRGMPARRILNLTARWTEEMLAIPEVWKTVERLVARLMKCGTIDDPDEIFKRCERVNSMWSSMPKWRKRLSMTKAERWELTTP